MTMVFEEEHQQKLVLHTEGNEIFAAQLPIGRGGEYMLRHGYLSDLTAVRWKEEIWFAWHSLEHHIILSALHRQKDQIILSDSLNMRQYGGLQLLAGEDGLWLFYTGKDPSEEMWRGFFRCLKDGCDEEELPGVFSRRPILELFCMGSVWLIRYGALGEERCFLWKEEGSVVLAEEWAAREERKKIQEQERQIAYISEQYEALRGITIRLQEDGKRMMEYIRQKK